MKAQQHQSFPVRGPEDTLAPTPKTKPGSGWFAAAIIIFAVGMFILVVSANTTDRYGFHTGPTLQTYLMTFVVPFILAAIGFGRRVLAALEQRNK